jgi:hypothetical protein
MNTSIITPPSEKVYQLLLEEIKSTIVESEFTSRWALIEGYHHVGELIVTSGVTDLSQIATDIQVHKRTIQRCVRFFKKFPDLNRLPEGKNASWNMILTKYLPENPKEKETEEHLIECPNCKFKFTAKDL